MIRIPLIDSRGHHVGWAQVDDADYEWLAAMGPWRMSEGYAIKRGQRMHRVISGLGTGDEPGLVVDHVNRDRLDNRRENLRVVTARENAQNQERTFAREAHGFEQDYVATMDIAKALGVATITVYKWRQRADFPAPYTRVSNGFHAIWRSADIAAWAAATGRGDLVAA